MVWGVEFLLTVLIVRSGELTDTSGGEQPHGLGLHYINPVLELLLDGLEAVCKRGQLLVRRELNLYNLSTAPSCFNHR
jgi:hypothetical protein